MAGLSIPHFTLHPFFFFCFLLFQSSTILSINITSLLSPYPDLSDFNNLLTTSSVAQDLIQRSSLTLLAVPNTYLRSSLSDLTRPSLSSSPSPSPANIADVLRYHVLLQYLTWSDLHNISSELITTLYQTTGRANGNLGAVNITRTPPDRQVYIRSPVSYSQSNITVLSLVKTLPYNVSIFTVNALLVPYGFDLMASENRPPLGLNITRALIDGHNFNIAATMLAASDLTKEFQDDEAGAGITLFVPTDSAFGALPNTDKFQSLPAEEKANVLRFHVLHSYYPLGSLQSIVNPVQPTLATERIGAGRYTLNITRVNGSIAIDTGIVQASITQTVIDQNPIAIFAVSRVLLPKELFGKESMQASTNPAQPPGDAFSPDISPGLDDDNSPSKLPYPPVSEKVRANSDSIHRVGFRFSLFLCILLYVLV